MDSSKHPFEDLIEHGESVAQGVVSSFLKELDVNAIDVLTDDISHARYTYRRNFYRRVYFEPIDDRMLNLISVAWAISTNKAIAND